MIPPSTATAGANHGTGAKAIASPAAEPAALATVPNPPPDIVIENLRAIWTEFCIGRKASTEEIVCAKV